MPEVYGIYLAIQVSLVCFAIYCTQLMEDIGYLIRSYRNHSVDARGRHLSQIDLTLEIGWENPSTLSRIESSKVIPTKKTIVKIAKGLKLDRNGVNKLLHKAGYLGINESEYEEIFL